jgi:hypothetical protein
LEFNQSALQLDFSIEVCKHQRSNLGHVIMGSTTGRQRE